MARLYLTVEGQTEQVFAMQLLKPHLLDREVFLLGAELTALGKKKGHVHRGGMSRYPAVKNDIVRRLNKDRGADAFFTTMIDLYAIPKDFPGYVAASDVPEPYQRVERMETSLGEDIGDPRFIPYIQLHEFEALLLSDPTAFGSYYHGRDREIESLVELCDKHDTPERINDGEQTAPSKRIKKVIPEYFGAKPTAGPIIAARIGLDTIRGRCPHFDQWVSKLEALGTPPHKA